MEQVIMQLIGIFGPAVLKGIQDWRTANHTTDMPTEEQIIAQMRANADVYLAEGAAWRAAHPDA